MFISRNINNPRTGFTLIEVVVGTALLLIVFMGIFSVYRLGMKVVFQSKARIIGISLANQKIEELKNLSYGNVGTFQCHPEHLECEYGGEWVIEGTPTGPIKKEQTAVLNNINYTIITNITYGINCSDGVGIDIGEECEERYDDSCSEIPCPADDCPKDYKKAKITISWGGDYKGETNLETSISPKIKGQECGGTGGFLVVKVRDSLSQQFPSPQIDVENLLTYYTDNKSPESGECTFILPPAGHVCKITVSKDEPGYTSVSTYGFEDEYNGHIIITPLTSFDHAQILENDFIGKTYHIDKISSFLVKTFSDPRADNFFDLFENENYISEKYQVIVSEEKVALEESSPSIYYDTGYVISEEIAPIDLVLWQEFLFSDDLPENTEIKYRIRYYNEINLAWENILDVDLPGNSAGFLSSPIDISGLSIVNYPSIKIKANLFTADTSVTPTLEDWHIFYTISEPISIANVDFRARSEKMIGYEGGGDEIWIYDKISTTDDSGQITLPNLEWDRYYFSNFSSAEGGLDLIKSEPKSDFKDGFYIPADTTQEIKFFLETPYYLLVEVNDLDTGKDIIDADVHLYNVGLAYDENQPTNPDGSVIFLDLENDTYQLEITADGYDPFPVEGVSISGKEVKVVELIPIP